MSGRGVTGDDQCLDALVAQIGRDLATIPQHRVRALRSVGHARRIAEINDALVGKLGDHLADDRETAHPRIEDAYRVRVAHRKRMLAVTVTVDPCEMGRTFALKYQRFAATYASAPEKRWLKMIAAIQSS